MKRAAFDIGSGCIKMQIGSFNSSGKLLNVYGGLEVPCLFGSDWVKSKELSQLSEEIQKQGLSTLHSMKIHALDQGVTEFRAVATEVFRKARNGNAFLEKVKEEIGVRPILVSQDVEAQLGFATGNTFIPDAKIVWDSGAASFQISCKLTNDMVQSYMAPFGTSVVGKVFYENVRVKYMKDGSIDHSYSINPVSAAEIDRLVNYLVDKMPSNIPDWLAVTRDCNEPAYSFIEDKSPIFQLTSNNQQQLSNPQILSVGGRNSMFQVARAIVQINKIGEDDYNTKGNSAGSPFRLSIEDVRQCIRVCLDRDDDYIKRFVDYPNSDGPHSVLCKLSLLYAVMMKLKLTEIQSICTFGNCAGVLNTEHYWNK